MLKKTIALFALAVASAVHAGTPAPAAISPTIEPDEISYNNVSISWQRQWAQLQNIDVDGNGIAAGLEFSPVNHLYLALNGSWNDVEFSVPGASVGSDYWTLNAGVGGYVALANNIHFVTEVGASYGDLDFGNAVGSLDGWGIYVTPHIRAKFGKFETHLGATYNSNDAALNEWSVFARALFEVCPSADIFVTGTYGLDSGGFDDVFGLNVGLRLKF